MKTTCALAALMLLATACNPFAVDPDPTLEIRAYEGEHLVTPWRNDTTKVLVRQRFDDPNGFAGLEIVLVGDYLPTRTYTASSLAGNPKLEFKVPDTGVITVTARIVQDNRAVAEVSGQWGLRPKIQWAVEVDRAPFPMGNGATDLQKPVCRWFWCKFVWGDAIAEDAANYPDEALWVTVFGYHPGECGDVC